MEQAKSQDNNSCGFPAIFFFVRSTASLYVFFAFCPFFHKSEELSVVDSMKDFTRIQEIVLCFRRHSQWPFSPNLTLPLVVRDIEILPGGGL